jgi:hypothetical protein
MLEYKKSKKTQKLDVLKLLFSDFSYEWLSKILTQVKILRCHFGQYIYNCNSKPDGIYLIVKGLINKKFYIIVKKIEIFIKSLFMKLIVFYKKL